MYYHLTLEEINGEQEYGYDYLVTAPSMEVAEQIAEEQARSFYCDEDVEKNEDGWYEFFGGSIAVKIAWLAKTTKAAFVKRMLAVKTIGGET